MKACGTEFGRGEDNERLVALCYELSEMGERQTVRCSVSLRTGKEETHLLGNPHLSSDAWLRNLTVHID